MGYRENNKYSRLNFFLNAQYFGRQTNLALILHTVDLYGQIPSSLNEEDFISDPEKAADNWLAVKGYEQYTKLIGGLRASSTLSQDISNHLVVLFGSSDPYESRPFNILDERSFSSGIRDYVMIDKNAINLQLGAEYFHEWYDWKIYETMEGKRGQKESHHKENRQYLNLFGYIKWQPQALDNLILDAAMNLNLLHYDLETLFRLDSLDNSGSYNYAPVLSPRIGLNYMLLPDHYIFASVGHGFSAPSLEETLLPEGTVNTKLRPETGWNFEIGMRGYLFKNRISYDAAFYTIYLNDLLVTERITEEIFTGVNAGSARNSGLEIFAKLYLTDNKLSSGKNNSGRLEDASGSFASQITAGFSLSDNRFIDFIDDGTDYGGNHLPGVPGAVFHTILLNSVHNFESRLQYNFTGSQWMTDGNDDKYDAYHLLHLQLSWYKDFKHIPFRLELFGGIKNILNTHYASMILVNAPSFGSNPPRYFYPGLPRQFHAGLVLSYFK
jgi:iron complex outermembrane receptor protein